MTELNIPTEQTRRQHSAEAALAQRCWTILDHPGGWKVRTPNDTYTIMLLLDARLICSCPDFECYGRLGIQCKHICGLLIYLEEGGRPLPQNPIQQET